MPRVVLDTNIFISALVFGGKPRLVLQHALARRILAASPFIQEEVAGILKRKFAWSDKRISNETFVIWEKARMVYPAQYISAIADDPDDNRILECAVDAGAEYIVSGDSHLLALKAYENIDIMTATQFLQSQSQSFL